MIITTWYLVRLLLNGYNAAHTLSEHLKVKLLYNIKGTNSLYELLPVHISFQLKKLTVFQSAKMFTFLQLILWLLIDSVVYSENYFETFFIERQHKSRNAISLEQFLWPDGTVPYVFDGSFNENDQKSVLAAMDLIVEKTCVKFVEKTTSQVEHIRFLKVRRSNLNLRNSIEIKGFLFM